jgi:hypothetical protein
VLEVLKKLMNFVSILVDFALPAVAVVGSGLLTYALTGGEEEFPPENEPTESLTINYEQNFDDNITDNQNSKVDMIIELIKNQGDMDYREYCPKWADEVYILFILYYL